MQFDRIAAACLGLAVPIVSGWLLLKGAREHSAAQTVTGAKVLRVAKAHIAWLYLSLCLSIIGFGSDLLFGKVNPSESITFWAASTGFVTLIVVMAWFAHAYRVEYDSQKVLVRLPGGLIREIPWANVRAVVYKKGAGVKIEVRNGKGHTVPSFLPGVEGLVEVAGSLASRAA